MSFLGIDVGTGGTRAVIVDEAGKVIASASSEHEPFRAPHPGWAEQDPEDWWRAAQEAISDAIRFSGAASELRLAPLASQDRCTARSCSTPPARCCVRR